MDHSYVTRQESGLSRSLRDGDFEEEDVWGVLKQRKHDSGESISSRSLPRSIPTAARMVPRGSSGTTTTTTTSNPASHEPRVVLQQSAPVNIPDWSKICGKNSKRSSKMVDGDDNTDEDYFEHDDGIIKDGGDSDDDEDDEGDGFDYNGKMPPHEFIARRLAKSQIPSFSVFEGVGRTLKGRDLSKVRNAVLTKTGFLESL